VLRPLVYMLRQDDPSKCTAAKLVKFRIAEPARHIGRRTIVLNPFSSQPVTGKTMRWLIPSARLTVRGKRPTMY